MHRLEQKRQRAKVLDLVCYTSDTSRNIQTYMYVFVISAVVWTACQYMTDSTRQPRYWGRYVANIAPVTSYPATDNSLSDFSLTEELRDVDFTSHGPPRVHVGPHSSCVLSEARVIINHHYNLPDLNDVCRHV